MTKWREIPDFDHYSVSDRGEVRNDKTGRIISPFHGGGNHRSVGLWQDGTQRTRIVARLVLEAFVPNFDPVRFTTPIFLNGDTWDCRAENLQWRPRWFAMKHTRQFHVSSQESRPVRELTGNRYYADVWDAVREHGLLYNDIVLSIYNRTYVFPTFQRFEWAD